MAILILLMKVDKLLCWGNMIMKFKTPVNIYCLCYKYRLLVDGFLKIRRSGLLNILRIGQFNFRYSFFNMHWNHLSPFRLIRFIERTVLYFFQKVTDPLPFLLKLSQDCNNSKRCGLRLLIELRDYPALAIHWNDSGRTIIAPDVPFAKLLKISTVSTKLEK